MQPITELFKLVFSFASGIISLIVVYALLNGLIYGAQELYHLSDVKHCEALEMQIDALKKEIASYEDIYKRRKLNNNEYNKYSQMIDTHNELVKKYNILAKKAYSRWWLLPFPVPSRHL